MPAVNYGVTPYQDSVASRLGALRFERGCPTPETSRKLFDEMDFQRAVQVYLWAYPAVSFESIRIANKRDLGIDYGEMGIADQFVDPKSIWLTANDTTIYAFANIDLSTGAVVVEIPPGAIVGLVDDFWERSLTDVGLPGRDAGNGGRYLLLPPGDDDADEPDGYYVVRATMNNHNMLVRGIIVDGDIQDAVHRVQKVKVYPWTDRRDPRPTRFVSISGAVMDTTPPGGIEYWNRLAAVIERNPVQEHDRFFMAMLKPLGMEKGKPFEPDARQIAILEEATVIGDAMARNVMYESAERIQGGTAFAGTQWDWVIQVSPDHEAEYYCQLDERLQYTYGAIYLSPAIGRRTPGPGANYIQAFRDRDGEHFDGGQSYRLRLPADPPAAQFWSLTLYDTVTRSMVQSGMNDAARSGYDEFHANADGSIDFIFGPQKPAAVDANWIETVPGRGFYPMVRFYTPTAPLFDGSWALTDIERL
ncbi:DUF1254 domain-containing protein [Microbacterium sp. B35-30]|uniref:DUF1254 domain-containing protein n=1 Tax=Microbacterium sp. B35-30 TaxID=1962642 RepID=UPI0013D6B056|nr:DUF1254 domain-containing protein [Microbacterium sp. B35-30]